MNAARHALTVAIFGLVSVATTWPLAVRPGELLVTRQFDLYGLLWLLQAAPSVGADLVSPLGLWPIGEPLGTLDSFVAFLAARALGGVDPVRIAAGFVLLGPVASAWAAERCAARLLGASWPWSIVAGLAYGFGPATTTALLEGHVYDALNPWLPLLAWAWGAALSPSGRAVHGLAAGVAWTGALLTSAYVGVCATLVVVGLAPVGMRARLRWGPPLAAAAVALPAGALYAAVVGRAVAGRALDEHGVDSVAAMVHSGSAHLTTLAAWYPLIDLRFHSISGVVGFTTLALAAAAPVVLRGRAHADPPWRTLLALGAAALLLALGPTVDLTESRSIALPTAGLAVSVGEWVRFPGRYLWVASLALGAVGALVASRLAARGPLRTAPLLAAAVIDAVIGQGTAFRIHRVPADVPSAYRAIEGGGAVLELLPEFLGTRKGQAIAFNDIVCSHQRAHGHPLFSLCLTPFDPTGPRVRLGRHLFARLFSGETGGLSEEMAAFGVSWVVLHPDLLPRGDRRTIEEGLLAALGDPAARTFDGGEQVAVWRTRGPVADRALARRRLEALP